MRFSIRFFNRILPLLAVGFFGFSGTPKPDFAAYLKDFAKGYEALAIPELTLGYREYFDGIPGPEKLQAQQAFFEKQKAKMKTFGRNRLLGEDQVRYDHLQYEVEFNLERLALEKAWVAEGRNVPSNGLCSLKNRERWYPFFIQKFTTLNWTPEQVAQFGHSEVARVKQEIRRIRLGLGFQDSMAFQASLQADSFYLKDKQAIVQAFGRNDSTVRAHLKAFAGVDAVPPILPMEWPDAGANTPPGIYLNRENNAFGKDVFQYNFYSGRFNRRALEWLYMHEALPGHHLQFSLRAKAKEDPLQALFMYPGNFEGWACYVEYYGKDLGMYRDPYSELGKWEWDLVRSARLVLDAGIHAQGWTRAQALAYWKANIPGQDEIAEREVTRVTNWPAQALSYKLGAEYILQLRRQAEARDGVKFSPAKFHQAYLNQGMRPLVVGMAGIE